MYRPHRQFLAAFGVLAALAVLDMEPRAAAAYQSVSDAAPAGYGSGGDPDEDPADHSQPNRDRDEVPAPTAHSGGIGGMPSPGSAAGSVPVVGDLPRSPLPEPELVVYFRESPASLYAFLPIDSLLDPPRPG